MSARIWHGYAGVEITRNRVAIVQYAGGQPPWGCDCSFCNEPDDEEDEYYNPEFYGFDWLIDS